MKLTTANLEEAELDLRKLNDPAWGGFNLLYGDNYFAKSLTEKWGMSLEELDKRIDELKSLMVSGGSWRARKKWHMKLTKFLCDFESMALSKQEEEVVTELTMKVQMVLAGREKDGEPKPRGRPTNEEKREHIKSLALCNETLSMSAIARHVGCSDALVAKVFRSRSEWDKREDGRTGKTERTGTK